MTEKSKSTCPVATAIIGGAWGDEGKGKVASYEAKNADLVIRSTGGANAGHTVVYNGKKIALHLVPGGIVYPQTTCLIGQGVVVEPEVLFEEIRKLEDFGIPNVRERLKISGRAHIIGSYHKELDEIHEMLKNNPVGTTKRGIGPAYSDKDNRIGIRVYDLLLPPSKLEAKIEEIARVHNILLDKVLLKKINERMLLEEYWRYGKEIKDMVVDADHLVDEFVLAGKKIVVEGAQAYRLDKDFGDYPNVTSSNTVTDGALIGGHLNHKDLKETIVILKAYFSRVGNGPFPTEQPSHIKDGKVVYENGDIHPLSGDVIREFGHEYGATTGRPRRTGWFDAVLVRSCKRALGPDYLCINHLDTLGEIGCELSKIKMCIKYNYQGAVIDYYPDDIELTGEIPKPVYLEFEGGWHITHDMKKFEDLPEMAIDFIREIEEQTGIPVKYIGIGPENEDLIVRENV